MRSPVQDAGPRPACFYGVSKPTRGGVRDAAAARGRHDRTVPRVLGPALGVVLVLIGLVWTLQGAGILPGSFMTGDRLWLVIGLACVAAGAALLLRVVRGRARR